MSGVGVSLTVNAKEELDVHPAGDVTVATILSLPAVVHRMFTPAVLVDDPTMEPREGLTH